MYFYQFLGAHSLLIGLLPFFLPVYLWTHGLSLAGLCVLIGVSGLAFAASLQLWQRWASKWPLRRLVAMSFVLEVVLVIVVGLLTTVPGMALYGGISGADAEVTAGLLISAACIGVFNGLYNGFFWTTQRTLFLQRLGSNDTGKQYGNFQIFVTLFLKAGILLGGVLLDIGGFVGLLAISAGVCAVSDLWLAGHERAHSPLQPSLDRVNSRQIMNFSDRHGSRRAFAVDGIFLYLESHFWTLSLFLLVDEDFTQLGVAVVLLAFGFALLFFLIKNRIDRSAIERVYEAAVYLYVVSWLLRFTLTTDSSSAAFTEHADIGLLVTLLLITFFSSFFRLAFNKRFFDVARGQGDVRYLLIKSYSSQWILGLFFCALGIVLFMIPTDNERTLQVTYLGAAVFSLAYLSYKDKADDIPSQ